MRIKKFLHSCLLLEKDGKRLLIDPGAFSFIEGKLKPEDIGPVDAIFITHKHLDHFDPSVLKKFVSFGSAKIYTIEEIGQLLKAAGLSYERIQPRDEFLLNGFRVKVYSAPHGRLPIPVPDNIAIKIDNLLHPGDSFAADVFEHCDLLALPIAGPWATLNDGMAMTARLKPKIVIPIHDAIIKDFMLSRMYDVMLKPALAEANIDFRVLALNEEIQLE